MGGHDSQRLLPWRGIHSSPGPRKPPAHHRITNLTQTRNLDLPSPLPTRLGAIVPWASPSEAQLQADWVILGKHR
jgi:hypothetical protein